MSQYPAAAAQGLYNASTDELDRLGAEYAFVQDDGVVWARYLQNKQGASVAAGQVVNFGSIPGSFATDAVGDTVQFQQIAGVVLASCTTDGYAWVAFRGPVTNAQLAATYASSASTRMLSVDANGRFATVVSTATTADVMERALGLLSNTTATVDSGTGSDGKVILYWR